MTPLLFLFFVWEAAQRKRRRKNEIESDGSHDMQRLVKQTGKKKKRTKIK